MIHVVTALIRDSKGRVLLQRRAQHRQFGGLLETPGGKVESYGESYPTALKRELFEELGLTQIEVGKLVFTTYFGDPCKFTVYFYDVNCNDTNVLSREDATDVEFVDLSLLDYDECVPSLQRYMNYLYA